MKVCPGSASREILCPFLAVRVASDEPGICLRLEHKDRIATQHQVVDLRQAEAVLQDDVVQCRRAQKRQLPRDGGLDTRGMFEAARDGKLRALALLGVNPVLHFPDRELVIAALQATPFVVVRNRLAGLRSR